MDSYNPRHIPLDKEGPLRFHGTSAGTKNHKLGTPGPGQNKPHLKKDITSGDEIAYTCYGIFFTVKDQTGFV